jgi:hypothetical protein
MAVLTLSSEIKPTGINQKALHELLTNLVTVVNELVDDHASNKTAMDANNTAIDELIVDHGTFRTVTGALKTAVNAVISAAATAVAPVTSSAPAALTASAPAGSSAALTNSTDLTLNEG